MAVNAKTPQKSCLTCPASMSTKDQIAKFGRDFGGGKVCGVKLLMIERPGVTNSYPVKNAEKCDSFGMKPEFKPEAKSASITVNVAFPRMPKLEEPDPDSNPANAKIVSCSGCRFFMPRHVTTSKVGWEAGFCRAKGSLLLDDRLWQYAIDCTDKQEYLPNDGIKNEPVMLLPEFEANYGKVTAANLLKSLRENTSQDPFLMEPDKAAGPKGAEYHVRGWRRVADQKRRGPDIFLPMFDTEWFKEHDRSAYLSIPRVGDQEAPEHYLDHSNFVYRAAVMWMRLRETPAVWGPAGVGKTELFRHLAWLMAAPFTRISITESSELDDLAGKMMFTPDRGTYFHYGRVPQAWQKPNVLCIDEPNTGPPSVWQFLRPMTDNSKQLVIDQNEGERIIAHRFAFLGMAMNPSWDVRNVGAQVIGDADGSRLMHISMGLPPAEVEHAIISKALERDRWPAEQIKPAVDMVMRIATDLRDLSNSGQIDTSWGIRHQIKVARAVRYTSWIDAYLLGVADSLDPQQSSAILDVVRSYAGDED